MHHLPRDVWTARAAEHRERALAVLAPTIERRQRGERHPVWDFLFDYYRLRPAELVAWSPGAGVVLDDAPEFAERRHFRMDEDGSASVDAAALVAARRTTLEFTGRLLSAVSQRPPQFGCFGLHEWAMVYRQPADRVRHGIALRFSTDETAGIVESHELRCTHFDAFRFFTPPAVPLNHVALTRDDQVDSDQGGCLHANMDLYKWAGKLHPLTSSTLLFDCFELARDVRELDMRASPYDLRPWGFEPVAVETAAGKADYVRQQRGFAERAQLLRERLRDEIDVSGLTGSRRS
ncbi:hypothetical protein [Aestuariimicrobium kwangyangense]|uniref:hypothetical protein n=1 Tax=Aestuariimicrobium kwangyangense TaxID=396389 RepID=UPI0003B66A84|nr:hypothetical protein [Aestuariimicrobium kwangyangense]